MDRLAGDRVEAEVGEMRITWFLLVGLLVAMVLSITLIDNRIPAPPGIQPGQTEPPPANPLAPPPGQQ